MFIIPNVYVDDKHLAKLLTAMAGVVIKMDMPRPVINAMVDKGEIKAISKGGSAKAGVANAIAKFAKGTELPISQIRTMIKDVGGSPDSASYYINSLKNEKVIKLKQRGTWIVL